MEHIISREQIEQYIRCLHWEEKSPATIQKYTRALNQLLAAAPEGRVDKDLVTGEKNRLLVSCAPSSVNGFLAAWNGFFVWAGWHDCRVKPVRIQRELFLRREKELTKAEYYRLLTAAKKQKNPQLFYILQTICATGIRISELPFITAESLHKGKVRIHCKGKVRTILLPRQLCQMLKKYCRGQKIAQGSVFVSKNGKPLDRSNIWRAMKALCRSAQVDGEKVFPHNLRHLFARCFYALEKDLDALAAVLGHSNINTTRIYTMSTGQQHMRILERLRLLI